MSFNINWSQTRSDLSSMTKDLLNNALNSGKSNILTSQIEILNLEFGNQQPNFEILEIGELTKQSFRGIFKLDYDGDARLNLKTTVEANPINIYTNNTKDVYGDELTDFISPNFVMSNDSFSIPLNLQLSQIKINSIIIIVFSKTKGLTLVFRNEPLEKIVINSSFDDINPLKDFLQKKIETQIKDIIKDILPSLLYELSLNYVSETNNIEDIHKKLLEKLQEEKKTLFKDLDEEEMSTKNLMILSRLSASCQSFAIDKDRFNSGIMNKTTLKLLENKSSSQIQSFKISNVDKITQLELDELIGNINSCKNIKVSRRKIKLNGSKKKHLDISSPPLTFAHESTSTEIIESESDTSTVVLDSEPSFIKDYSTQNHHRNLVKDIIKHPIPESFNLQYDLQQLHNHRQQYLNSPLKPQFNLRGSYSSTLFKGLNYTGVSRLSPPPPPPPPYSFSS